MAELPGIENELISDMTLIEYVKYIQHRYYPDMNINFMEFFMSMYMDGNKFCISSDALADYNVLSVKSGKLHIQSSNIQRLLDQLSLLENKDYELVLVREYQLSKNGINHGTKKRYVYMMTQKAFKKCLMSSTNNPQYKDYYILLEECVYYYDKQQKAKLLEEKQTLLTKIDTLLLQMDKQCEKIDNLTMMVSDIKRLLKDRAVPPEHEDKTNGIAILKNNNNNSYYIIRRQKKTINKAIKDKVSDGFTPLFNLHEVPNAIYLCDHIFSYLKKNKKISCNRNDFVLTNLSDEDLKEIIIEVFDNRIELNAN